MLNGHKKGYSDMLSRSPLLMKINYLPSSHAKYARIFFKEGVSFKEHKNESHEKVFSCSELGCDKVLWD